jgi:hypothetical protein
MLMQSPQDEKPKRVPFDHSGPLYKFFDAEEHARRFRQGKLLFRPMNYFRAISGSRADPCEGEVLKEIALTKVTIENAGERRVVPEMKARIGFVDPDKDQRLILCLSHRQTTGAVSKFGCWCTVITDWRAFVRRIRDVVGDVEIGPVQYYDEEYPSFPDVPAWLAKHEEYEDENEIRLSILSGIELDEREIVERGLKGKDYGITKFEIDVGDLSDIVEVTQCSVEERNPA